MAMPASPMTPQTDHEAYYGMTIPPFAIKEHSLQTYDFNELILEAELFRLCLRINTHVNFLHCILKSLILYLFICLSLSHMGLNPLGIAILGKFVTSHCEYQVFSTAFTESPSVDCGSPILNLPGLKLL